MLKGTVHHFPAWSSAPGADPPGCLASLRTVRCHVAEESSVYSSVYVPAGLSRPGASLSVTSPGRVLLGMSGSPFGQFCGRALHVQARCLTVDGEGVRLAQLLDMLFAPGLEEVCLDCEGQRAPEIEWINRGRNPLVACV